MNCSEWEERIALEPASAEVHLAECAACRTFAEELRQTQAALEGLRGEEPDESNYVELRARVLDRVSSRRRRVWAYATAAVLVAGLGISALWQSRSPEPARTPVVARVQPPPEPTAPPPAVAKPRRLRRPAPVAVAESSEPIVVKMLTDDPDIVIFWLIDKKGD